MGYSPFFLRVAAPVVLVLVYLAQLWYVRRRLSAETRRLHLTSAKQLADNLLASEIAKRVAVSQSTLFEHSVFRYGHKGRFLEKKYLRYNPSILGFQPLRHIYSRVVSHDFEVLTAFR